MLVSTFELLVKPQLPTTLPPGAPVIPGIGNLSRKIIQGYFLTVANVNFFPVTVSVVFTVKFPITPVGGPPRLPLNFADLFSAVDISGENIFPPNSQAKLVPEVIPQNNKARLTFTIPDSTTGLLILQPPILTPGVLANANFEARGYVEIFLSSLSGASNEATLLVTPEHRGTFFRNLTGATPDEVGLDQIAYALPVKNGGHFVLSNG